MDRYNVICKIGEGAFGVVLKANDTQTNTIVALKQIPLKNVEEGHLPDSVVREIQALRNLRHKNILRLLDVLPKFPGITLVLECMPYNLSKMVKRARKGRQGIPESHVKSYMQMLLEGIAHMHERRVMHRDLKPKNLLISEHGELKICDFGLARIFYPHGADAVYTNQVSTRWYKAPELLYGSINYSFSIDLWAAGCIFAELLTCKPLFAGQSDIDQLSRIFSTFGSPNESNWPGVSQLPDFGKIIFNDMSPIPLESLFPQASKQTVNLLQKFLVYCPHQRITAREALRDPYFSSEPFPCALSDLVPPVNLP